MKKHLFRIFCISFLIAGFYAAEASADCARITPQKAAETAAAIFSGTVTSNSGGEVRFDVDTVWKGPASRQLSISQRTDIHSSIDIDFIQGEKYLVYAVTENPLTTNECSRTRKLSDAAEDLKALGAGRKAK